MKLAIKGHPKRGKEIIEILEMLGGNNKKYRINITECNLLYTIREGDDAIIATYPNSSISKIYTLEEFLEKFPYKVGDKVQYKGATSCGSIFEVEKMRWEENTVKYTLCLFGCNYKRSTLPAEYLQPYKEETMEEPKELLIGFIKDKDGNMVLNTHKDYEIKEVDGKFMLLKKKPQYPKTYEECCNVLGYNQIMPKDHILGYKGTLLSSFQQLLICRDAYWKIAGEDMGLDKPWEPDWNDCAQHKFGLYTLENEIRCINLQVLKNIILVFPTEEMRDAFYENFKDLIEQCKELL